MAAAQKGNTVKVHYTGTLTDGTTFDSSRDRDPLQCTLGEGQVIPGFEQAIEGMEQGEKKQITIPADKAYGEHSSELIQVVPKTELPEELDPKVGQQLQAKLESGQAIPVVITNVSDDTISVDANHPLAGKDLNFDLELVEIVSA